MSRKTRRAYAALTPQQQAAVDAILAPETAKGWIPKDADIQAAIDIVLADDRANYPGHLFPNRVTNPERHRHTPVAAPPSGTVLRQPVTERVSPPR